MPLLSLFTNSIAKSFSKKLSTIENVTIIGCGLMGSGIAQVCAEKNFNVTIVDRADEVLENGKKIMENSLNRVAKRLYKGNIVEQKAYVDGISNSIKYTSNLSKAVNSSDLIIEAIVEILRAKQDLFDTIQRHCSESVLLATNTSSLPLREISKNIHKKDRFGGLHFFNPVPIMKLLEVVRADSTSDETFSLFIDFGKKLDKTTVACKDTPGFIVNRLLIPYMFEAIRLTERGDASMEDIDKAMKLGAGHPMGPFELMDYVGLDTTKFIQNGWHSSYPTDPIFSPNDKLTKLVDEGKFGRKTGEGFYKYN